MKICDSTVVVVLKPLLGVLVSQCLRIKLASVLLASSSV
jgi:hypothetical protein